MPQKLSVCGMRIVLWIHLALVTLLSGRTVELGFPGLAHRVKVDLPEDHDPSKKYPTFLYYHGTNGKPDTHFIRYHSDPKKWIIVGMTYHQQGKMILSKEHLKKEATLLRSVKRHLETKYGMDPKKCYVGGFSKGEWMADLLLQADNSLAGGAIFGAGHLYNYHPKSRPHPAGKPVFIAVGRLDGNYPFAMNAMMFHRKLGAQTHIDIWPDVGHTIPSGESQALKHWLALAAMPRPAITDEMENNLRDSFKKAAQLKDVEGWTELRRIQALPSFSLMPQGWQDKLKETIARLEKSDPVKSEAAALAEHRKILFFEINNQNTEGIAKAHLRYQELAKKYPNTAQEKLAQHDHKRTGTLMRHFQEQKEIAKKEATTQPEKSDEIVVPEEPATRRRIPMNPLIR